MRIKRKRNLKCSYLIKTKIFILTILLFFTTASARENQIKSNVSVDNFLVTREERHAPNYIKAEKFGVADIKQLPKDVSSATEEEPTKPRFILAEINNDEVLEGKTGSETDIKPNQSELEDDDLKNPSQINVKEKFHWKPALIQSGIFLGVQHGFRMTQDKTTRELKGAFFRDWAQSVRKLRGWRDGDSSFTNYVAHPLQGGLTGRIFVNNSDAAKNQEFGDSKKYWQSRAKALAWSAAWSVQFELGPISEASIGNVGLNKKDGYSTMAYVDLVVTPVVGTGVLIGEDFIDKYILKNWLEKKIDNKFKIKILRSVLTPTTSFANLLRGKMPWKRDNRPF